MSDLKPRTDSQTEQQIREALAMKRAFGDQAAEKFLKLRDVDQALARRVLTEPERRRH